MRLKLLLVTVFAAGIGASYALADGGHGQDGAKPPKCTEVHVNGTVAAQTLTVTLTKGSRRVNLAPGSQVVLQVGAAGQTVNVNAEACASTTGSSTQYQVRSAELKVHPPKPTPPPPAGTTTAP